MPSIQAPKCHLCGETETVEVTDQEFTALQNTRFIQDALPNRDVDFRELLISGTHPECWNAMFPPEDED